MTNDCADKFREIEKRFREIDRVIVLLRLEIEELQRLTKSLKDK